MVWISSLGDLCLKRISWLSTALASLCHLKFHTAPHKASSQLGSRLPSLHPPSWQIEADPAPCSEMCCCMSVLTIFRCKICWQVRNFIWTCLLWFVFNFSTAATHLQTQVDIWVGAQRHLHVCGMFWALVMLVLMNFDTPFIAFNAKSCTKF